MKNKISLESKLITAFLLLATGAIIMITFLGESESEIITNCIDSGQESAATAYFDHAFRFLQTNKFSEAITNFKKAVKLDPEYSEAYMNLAIAYAKSNENDKAIATLQNALETENKIDYLIHLNMAQVYKRFDKEKAESSYKKAIELHPFPKSAYFNLGEFYWDIGKFDLSVEALKKGVELHNLRSYFVGGIKEALKINEDNTEFVDKLTSILNDNTKIDELYRQLDTTIFDFYYLKNNRKMAEKTDQIGYHYFRIREFENAVPYFEQSLKYWNSEQNRAFQHLKRAQNALAENMKS